VSSLVILAASVFEISCGKTDRQLNGNENPPAWVIIEAQPLISGGSNSILSTPGR